MLGRVVARLAQDYIRETLVSSPRFRAWAKATDRNIAEAPGKMKATMEQAAARAAGQSRVGSSGGGSSGAQSHSSGGGGSGGSGGGSGGSGGGGSVGGGASRAPDWGARVAAFAAALREEVRKDLGAK